MSGSGSPALCGKAHSQTFPADGAGSRAAPCPYQQSAHQPWHKRRLEGLKARQIQKSFVYFKRTKQTRFSINPLIMLPAWRKKGMCKLSNIHCHTDASSERVKLLHLVCKAQVKQTYTNTSFCVLSLLRFNAISNLQFVKPRMQIWSQAL